MSLEQGDRWYPADLRDNLIQQRESGHIRLRRNQRILWILNRHYGKKKRENLIVELS